MPKKSKEDQLRNQLVAGFKKAGYVVRGKVFSLGESDGFCADCVIGNAVVEVITSACDKKFDKLKRFRKCFGYKYSLFLFVDGHMKDILTVDTYDALYTEESLGLLIKKVIEVNKG